MRKRFIEAALRVSNNDVRAFCVTIAMTGCRHSEALELTWGQVDQTSRKIVIRSLKKRRTDIFRPVPVLRPGSVRFQ